MTLSFDGQVAIVTGAGNGLGRSHALELARRGAKVVVNDLGGAVDGTGSSPAAAELVVKEIVEEGGEAIANFDSVATPAGGEAIVESALREFGGIHIVVNNAGILRDGVFKNMTPAMVDPVIDVHLRGAFHVTRPAWEHMRAQAYGRIINTSSGSGVFGNFGQTNYGAAKMGLIGLTRVLALEGAKYNIATNAIAPIAMTRMTEAVMAQAERKLEASQVTPLVIYLAHSDCRVNGHFYSVGGGRVQRIVIGTTMGIDDPDLTPEQVAEHIGQIDDATRFTVR